MEQKEKAVADVVACLQGLNYDQAESVLDRAKMEIRFRAVVGGNRQGGCKSVADP